MLKQTELAFSSDTTDTIYSVAEFTSQVKHALESQVPASWVRGQVSNVKKQASGHIYFTLKDETSQISAVLFRGNSNQQSRFLQDGKQVILFGAVNVYEPRGTYQIIARWVLEDGIGRLQAEFEKLKKKLANEGLFDKSKKKPLPKHPKTVGIITSPTGAAIQDIISILKRRHWNGRIVLFPTLVQGEDAATNMVKRLKQAIAFKELDLLVIGRGGGSAEDLWCFNDETLVRELANCPIPTISAVGHEIDFTLCDFAADVRAETPSGAAELITSNYQSLLERISVLKKQLHTHVHTRKNELTSQIKWLSSKLSGLSPQKRLAFLNLRIDDLGRTLSSIINQQMTQNQHRLHQAQLQLHAIQPQKVIQTHQKILAELQKRLEGVSLQSTLKRGFAVMKTEEGQIISKKQHLKPHQHIYAQLQDGESLLEVLN